MKGFKQETRPTQITAKGNASRLPMSRCQESQQCVDVEPISSALDLNGLKQLLPFQLRIEPVTT